MSQSWNDMERQRDGERKVGGENRVTGVVMADIKRTRSEEHEECIHTQTLSL